METTKDRLIRFIEHKGLSKNKFEKICGLSTSYVSNISQSIQPKMVQKISLNFPELNTGWLLTGEGEMIKGGSDSIDTRRGGIPLIPHEAFAGYGSAQYNDLPIEEFYQIREFNTASFLLRVSGDSMAPRYNSGDLIACRRVDEVTFWQWHRIYAICTKHQGILLKRVEKSMNSDAITCVSENPDYDAFDIDKQEIISVALVLGGVVME